jgi:DNA mismatch repair protein MSH6
MDDDDSDDDQVVKKRRLQKGRKPDVKPSSSSSRPPLPPVRGSYTSTPSSSQASQPFTATPNVSSRPSSSSQSQPNSVYDRCSAQNSGGGKSLTFTPSGSNTPSNTPSSVSSTPYEPTGLILPEGVHGLGSHEHNGFDFLQPGKIKDKNGNRPDHPLYNPRTLYIPASVLKDQTPAMGQWWLIKQDNMDTVLFFKVSSSCNQLCSTDTSYIFYLYMLTYALLFF